MASARANAIAPTAVRSALAAVRCPDLLRDRRRHFQFACGWPWHWSSIGRSSVGNHVWLPTGYQWLAGKRPRPLSIERTLHRARITSHRASLGPAREAGIARTSHLNTLHTVA